MFKEHAQVHIAGCGRDDILTQHFIKPMTLTMTLNGLSGTHFISRITDSQRKKINKKISRYTSQPRLKDDLTSKSESNYCFYSLFSLFHLVASNV